MIGSWLRLKILLALMRVDAYNERPRFFYLIFFYSFSTLRR